MIDSRFSAILACRLARKLTHLGHSDLGPNMVPQRHHVGTKSALSRSDTLLRNTNMFVLAVRPESVDRYYAEHLIHRTPPSAQHPSGILVRSKSEVIVAGALSKLGISYE
jgi:hypothetical protein